MSLGATNLTVRYGTRRAIDQITLTVDAGELVCVVGPNGAGKSTLLRALAGVTHQTSGSVHRHGAVAYLAQAEPLPLDFRAADVVRLGRLPHVGLLGGLSAEDEQAVSAAMKSTATEALATRRMRELSGGEQQRVAIARALAQEAQALLLDEPLAHLDVRHQLDVMALVRAKADDGLAALMTLHDLQLATLATRVVLLHEGKVVHDGLPRDVLTSAALGRVFGVEVTVTERDGALHVLARRPS